MASRVVFVFLYGGFVEGSERFLRPSHVYFFTEEQSRKTTDTERLSWLSLAGKAGFRPEGRRWYADNSRESIRDDLMRNQLFRLGITQKLPGFPPTSSRPIHFLTTGFADLFDPILVGNDLHEAVLRWRARNLDRATLQRMVLRAQGVDEKAGDILVDMPDGTRIRIAAGPSSLIVKGLIEDFAKRHMKKPAVLWLSASDKKAYPQFVELAASVGLTFDLNAELPDAILAEMSDAARFILCEAVATDGAATEARKQALLALVRTSNIPETAVEFLSAFEDREAEAFRKNFSKLAMNSLVWFRTEPDLLVILRSGNFATEKT